MINFIENIYEQDHFVYDPDQINISIKEPTIEQLLKRIDQKALDLAPDFKRHANLWNNDTKSRLIESIIIRIPLSTFYIDATGDDEWIVVDGIQRLYALNQFILEKSFKLSGLEYLTHLQGKTFEQLERQYQRRIQETQVTIYLINKGTPPEVKYNIFKRINTGGLPMSPQELRHALNPGQANHFIAKLAGLEEFKQVVQLNNINLREMVDREFVLAFLSFVLVNYKNYAQYRSKNFFLSRGLVLINKLSISALEDLEVLFRKTMKAMLCFLDKKYFNNQALFETWSFWLSQLNEQELQKLHSNKETLNKQFIITMKNDPDFVKSISQPFEKIDYRFTEIENIIKGILIDKPLED